MTYEFDDRREVIEAIDHLLRVDAEEPEVERRLLELRKTVEDHDSA